MATDEERRRVAAELREYASFDCEDEGEEECLVDCADWGERVLNLLGCGDTEGECYAALADLIEPDTTTDTTKGIEFDAFSHGIDSIYEWCFEHLEGADGAEDELFCAIMSAIEDYWHPERASRRTARPVDREALLALADEMERKAQEYVERFDENSSTASALNGYASRIRVACGEVSEG